MAQPARRVSQTAGGKASTVEWSFVERERDRIRPRSNGEPKVRAKVGPARVDRRDNGDARDREDDRVDQMADHAPELVEEVDGARVYADAAPR